MSWYEEDNAGTIPEVGDVVAYNYSGQVAIGVIRSLGTRKRWPIFHIDRILPDKGESRIRGGVKCLVVIERNGEPVWRIND